MRAPAAIVQAGERRLASVESLRALAALGVLLFHAELLSLFDNRILSASRFDKVVATGSHGVFLFFSLTGYLLFRPFAQRAWGSRAPVDLRRYARNRALRILPLYYVAVVVLLLWQEGGGTATQWFRFPLFLQNYWESSNQTVDGPLWSIVVELQFYLVLPLLAWLVARGSRRNGGIALLNLAVVAFAGRQIAVHHHVIHDNVWRTTFVVAFVWFTPGLMLAWVEVCWRSTPRWLAPPFDRATTWFVAAVALWFSTAWWGWPAELFLVVNLLAVGSCVLPLRPGLSSRVLSWRPLAALGVASYSLYVWHVPILHAIDSWDVVDDSYWVLAAVGGVLCIAAAAVSYLLIERPFLSRRKTWSRSTAAAAVTAPSLPDGAVPGPRQSEIVVSVTAP